MGWPKYRPSATISKSKPMADAVPAIAIGSMVSLARCIRSSADIGFIRITIMKITIATGATVATMEVQMTFLQKFMFRLIRTACAAVNQGIGSGSVEGAVWVRRTGNTG